VAIKTGTTVLGLKRSERSKVSATLSDGTVVETTSVLLMLGYEPNTADIVSVLTEEKPLLDSQGYLLVDKNCQTSLSGVYGIGDVSNPTHPCTATALAMGTMAARHLASLA
jgi:thioredoxin reductase